MSRDPMYARWVGEDRARRDPIPQHKGGEKSKSRSAHELGLTDQEMSDLVELMRALTSDDILRQAPRAKPQTRLAMALSPN